MSGWKAWLDVTPQDRPAREQQLEPLAEAGFVEGRNLSMEFRFAYNDNSKLAELAEKARAG